MLRQRFNIGKATRLRQQQGTDLAGGAACGLQISQQAVTGFVDQGGRQGEAQGEVRGRVLAMYTIISQVVPTVSGLVAGALVYGLGAAHAIVAAGAVIAVLALINALWMGALRSYRGVAAARSGDGPDS